LTIIFLKKFFIFEQLFDIVVQQETLQNVIRSVTRNGKSILLTAIFGVIVVYVFTIIGFVSVREHFLVFAFSSSLFFYLKKKKNNYVYV